MGSFYLTKGIFLPNKDYISFLRGGGGAGKDLSDARHFLVTISLTLELFPAIYEQRDLLTKQQKMNSVMLAINSAQEIKTRALQAPDQALDSKPP